MWGGRPGSPVAFHKRQVWGVPGDEVLSRRPRVDACCPDHLRPAPGSVSSLVSLPVTKCAFLVKRKGNASAETHMTPKGGKHCPLFSKGPMQGHRISAEPTSPALWESCAGETSTAGQEPFPTPAAGASSSSRKLGPCPFLPRRRLSLGQPVTSLPPEHCLRTTDVATKVSRVGVAVVVWRLGIGLDSAP